MALWPWRAVALDLAFAAVGLALVWAMIAFALSQQQTELRRAAADDVASLDRGFEENVQRLVESIDKMLLFLRLSWQRDPASFDLRAFTDSMQASGQAFAFQTTLVDRDGRVASSTSPGLVAGIDLSDREHIRVQRERDEDALFISRPVFGRVSRRWSVQFTRRLSDAQGGFAGVAVISVDPYELSGMYSALDVGQGELVLAGLDGIVRTRAPSLDDYIGRALPADRVHWTPSALGLTEELPATLTHGALIQSSRKVPDQPLIALVARPLSDIYAPYYRNRLVFGIEGVVFSVLILVLSALLIRSKLDLIRSRAVVMSSRESLAAAVDNIPQGILMVDAQRQIRLISRRAAELLEVPAHLAREDVSFDEFLYWQVASGEFGPPDGANALFHRLASRGGVDPVRSVYERTRPNGTVIEVRTKMLSDGGMVRTFADISERKQSEERIRHLAHHDALTSLANRRMFNERLADAIARAQVNERDGFAVLCLDLDRFKLVNDLRGHAVGDKLLMQVADRIRASIRQSDWAARFGGDEFAILQTQADQPAAAMALARRLVDLLSESYEIDGQTVQIGTSIGVAMCPAHGLEADRLLQVADMALYKAKACGRGTFRLFEPGMDAVIHERRQLEDELRLAMAENQLWLAFQPICSVRDGQPAGFEALLRWSHPTRGPIAPGDFIPAAEESGMIVPLGRWVLRAACVDAVGWPIQARLSVNLSPAQFRDPDLPAEILTILRQTGFPPQLLTLEVTEGVLIDDAERALATMKAIRELGVRVALDDFGTGHASLTYLRRFPFDSIKVDRSFVQCLETDDSACAIVRSIMTLGQNLSVGVVAEGVETHGQLRMLADFGYQHVQGFLLGRPMTGADVRRRYAGPLLVAADT